MSAYIPLVNTPLNIVGTLPTSTVEDATPLHFVNITRPLSFDDFANSPAGNVTMTAFDRIKEFLLYGFHSSNSNPSSRVDRSLWLKLTSQLLVYVHQGIRRTHGSVHLPQNFNSLSPTEQADLDLFNHTVSSFKSFFSDYKENAAEWEICFRCLEECKLPVNEADWESILKSCGQNIQGAHRTIINDANRTLHHQALAWIETQLPLLQEGIISNLTNSDAPPINVDDPRLNAWAQTTFETLHDQFRASLRTRLTNEVIEPWASEALDHIRAQKLILLDTEKTRINEEIQAELAAFKADLKVQTAARKEKARSASDKAVESVARRSSRSSHCADPMARPSKSSSRSVSRSRAPSSEPIAAMHSSPDFSTPRASPIAELTPTRALTEPALSPQPPPTDISVGPPENTQEAFRLQVQTSQMSAHTFPPPSQLDIQGPPPMAVAPIPLSSSAVTSTDPPTSGIERMLLAMGQQLSQITEGMSSLSSRVGRLEQPSNTYSPSRPAMLWEPPLSNRPAPGQPEFNCVDETYAPYPSDGGCSLDDLNFGDAFGAYDNFEDMDAERVQNEHDRFWLDRELESLY